MAHNEWAAMESLQEVECHRNDVDRWEALRQSAIGMAWARESSLPRIDRRGQGAAAWSLAVMSDLTR